MRRVFRASLPSRTQRYLDRKQRDLNASPGLSARRVFDSARRTKAFATVVQTLESMTGRTARCMYCGDSRGTDVDHFWPLSSYRARAFLWPNMLLACSPCNRAKSARFDLDVGGSPLLINPTADDPWDHLDFDESTGLLTAVWRTEDARQDERGRYTVEDSGLPLNVEAVSCRRQRVARSLRRAVSRFCENTGSSQPAARRVDELLDEIRDLDDYGLAQWYFVRGGADDEPFSKLRTSWPHVWSRVVDGVACRAA